MIDIPLERLCDDSLGTNAFLNAESLHKKNQWEYILLVQDAIEILPEEIRQAKEPKRKELLEVLRSCYQMLCAQAGLLPKLRLANPEHSWSYYIQRAVEIGQELDAYSAEDTKQEILS